MNGGRRGVSILSHRPVTSSELKQDRLFFRESVSTFLLLVVGDRSYFPFNQVTYRANLGKPIVFIEVE